jgi:ergothioneine biosynthesis protein EgtB
MQASRMQTLPFSPARVVPSPLRARYHDVRRTTVDLTQPFSAEDQMVQSMPDASPVKWHLAHTAWFFETFVLENAPGYRPFDVRYEYLFNSYYKQLGSHPQRGSRGLMSRPSLEEVHAYRRWVDEEMDRHFDHADEKARAIIELGLNHEQQHQELIITDVKHALWSMPLGPKGSNRLRAVASAPPAQWEEIAGGVYQVGHSGEGFAFDNEGPRHEVLLHSYGIAARPVTNAEFLEFMQDGGYSKPELWLSDGWDTVCARNWNAPLYWEKSEGAWLEFTFSGLKEINPAEPVCHVSYYEADAFARWRGARLPREEEWEIAALKYDSADAGAFLEAGSFHPEAAHAPGSQWFGNVWEWTASPYVAYPGFAPAPGAIGEYNGKFMCNQFVLRGGSCATPASHIRATYRNFFPPHARWQFTGIRLAK